MTDKEKIRGKIDKKIAKKADEFAKREYETDGYERQWLSKGYYHGFMDANKGKLKEPVSVWHDANHQPKMFRKYLVRYSDGRVNGSWERHDDGFILWKDVVKEHGFTHWCYVEDLLNL